MKPAKDEKGSKKSGPAKAAASGSASSFSDDDVATFAKLDFRV